MGQRLDQPAGRVVRELRVAVESDYETGVRQWIWIADMHDLSATARRLPTQQPIEILELPAFPLPPDVLALRLAPFSVPVEQVEAVGPIAAVECFDPLHRKAEHRRLFSLFLFVGVGGGGEKRGGEGGARGGK